MTASLHPVQGTPGDVYDLLEPWVSHGGAPILVRTSGSTGEPKDAVLSHSAVLASARATLDRLGGPGQWLLALPVSGIAGVQVLVRSILGGTRPVLAAEHESLGAAREAFTAERRYAALVPTQVFRLAAAGRLDELCGFDAVLVGGAALDPEVVDAVRATGVNLVRTYGMTETCGGCVYDGIPLDGVEMRIDVDNPQEQSGQVLLSGPVLFDGYIGAPREDTWFPTADRGRILADGRLQVLGRLDDTVVSGGVNVPLPAVERAVRNIDGILDAAVVGVPDQEWGTRVVAAVVGVPGTEIAVAALRDALEAAGVPRTWSPRQVMVVADLPRLRTGKVDREQVRARAVSGD